MAAKKEQDIDGLKKKVETIKKQLARAKREIIRLEEADPEYRSCDKCGHV